MPRWIWQLTSLALAFPITVHACPHQFNTCAASEAVSAISLSQVLDVASDHHANPVAHGTSTSSARVRVESALKQTSRLAEKVRAASFPELEKAEIQVKLLKNDTDFFRTRFGLPQFFFRKKMHFLIEVNPNVFELRAPDQGLEAIIAHELSHLVYYSKGKRLRLFSLSRLLSKDFMARFERWTDLQAISRGYGEGLKVYRQWLYQNVPPKKLKEKQRNYFSPIEIDAILVRLHRRPELLNYWLKNIPRNLQEIEEQ